MARPRVFVSSTFFDLHQVRADLDYFIRDLGYEPVLNERGRIAYGSADNPEEYAYREVEISDILVAIIGGRYGSESASQGPYSISQAELKTAIQLGKQLYIFVERNVFAEFATYRANKSVAEIQYQAVDDPRIYEFLEEIEGLPKRNPTATFESARDITGYLREQWAGLFQRSLQEQERRGEMNLMQDMQNTTRTLNELVKYLTEERKKGDDTIQSILLTNHPAFQQLRELLSVPYRVFFTTKNEFNVWVTNRSFNPVEQKRWDDPEHAEWFRRKDSALLKVATTLFDEAGRLRVFTDADWNEEWITLTKYIAPTEEEGPAATAD
jgi:Domain of unknown function (DUF4062)